MYYLLHIRTPHKTQSLVIGTYKYETIREPRYLYMHVGRLCWVNGTDYNGRSYVLSGLAAWV